MKDCSNNLACLSSIPFPNDGQFAAEMVSIQVHRSGGGFWVQDGTDQKRQEDRLDLFNIA